MTLFGWVAIGAGIMLIWAGIRNVSITCVLVSTFQGNPTGANCSRSSSSSSSSSSSDPTSIAQANSSAASGSGLSGPILST